MNTRELDSIRELWLKEKDQYEEYAQSLLGELKELTRRNNVKAMN